MMPGKKRAGGLPQQFLLAATDERIYALALPKMSSGLKPRAVKELARWERRDVRVGSKSLTVGTEIVIGSAAEGERIECQARAATQSRMLLAAGVLLVA